MTAVPDLVPPARAPAPAPAPAAVDGPRPGPARLAGLAPRAAALPAPSRAVGPAGALAPRPALPLGPPGGNRPVPVAAGMRPLPRPAAAARPRARHWLLLASFLLAVVAPVAASAWYLWTRAADQFVSTMSFSIRREDATGGIDILGGITAFSSGGPSDASIVEDFIRSPDMVAAAAATLDLEASFSRPWPHDPVYAYDPSGAVEDLVDFWNRQVTVINDDQTGIVTVRAAAFSPREAKAIAGAVLEASSATVNRLSDQARDDAMRLARDELARAEARVREIGDRMTAFRTRTQLVDPQAEFTARMGVVTGLEAQLAEATVALDLLRQNGAPARDPRVRQGEKRIAALETQLAADRARVSSGGPAAEGESYAAMVAEYERMTADRSFAEQAYAAARAGYDRALLEAQRQTRYLAAHVVPNLPEQSRRPDRPVTLATIATFALLLWSILALVYYSLRDGA